MKSIRTILLVILALLPAQAHVGKLEELVFKNKKTYYLYNDSKTTLRLTGIPDDIDTLQAQIKNPPGDGAHARLIGKRNKTIEDGRYVDFVVELVPDKNARPQRKSIKLGLKGFSKNNTGGYDIKTSYVNFIRVKECPQQGESVCAIVKVRCREGSEGCISGQREVFRDFETKCAAEKAGAELHSYGTCE
ncbi:MAG: hypothetical protein OXU45_02005 [Candidatus Melainabacteria bacterium]|nr:hypothetical protein [Candidatus Melainabacteria bacterium]